MHRNTVYGHPEWARHKSSWRHWRHMVSICASGVIGGIWPPVMMSTLSALFVTMVNFGVLHNRFPAWIPSLQISITPFNLIAPVLAFLLVFRTNTSYQRFDEARKVWGSNVNRCRDLARQTLTWIRAPEDQPKLDIILRFIKAYPFYLKYHLTQGHATVSVESEVTLVNKILQIEETEAIGRAQNRPIYVLQVISEFINQCQILEYERVTMDLNLTQFHDNVGACERIFKTPIPIAYTRLTSRMLILWHLALPYGLWATCRWLTLPATFMSSAALFYIEQVGVLIEEPFWVLALDSICGGIGGAVDGLKAAHDEAMGWGVRSHNSDAHHHKLSSPFDVKSADLDAHHNKPNLPKDAHHHKPNLPKDVKSANLNFKMTNLEQIDESEDIPLINASNGAAPRAGDQPVIISFERSKSRDHHGPRSAHKDVNAVFSKLKSAS